MPDLACAPPPPLQEQLSRAGESESSVFLALQGKHSVGQILIEHPLCAERSSQCSEASKSDQGTPALITGERQDGTCSSVIKMR